MLLHTSHKHKRLTQSFTNNSAFTSVNTELQIPLILPIKMANINGFTIIIRRANGAIKPTAYNNIQLSRSVPPSLFLISSKKAMNSFQAFANILLAVNIFIHCQKVICYWKIILFLWLDADRMLQWSYHSVQTTHSTFIKLITFSTFYFTTMKHGKRASD